MSATLGPGADRPNRVHLRVNKPFLYISDSGPGIDPAVEELLFEPFITTKPSSEGRGLGLFVVKQLLAVDGVTIELTPERNDRGRRSTFRIDFTSVTEG
ncbi:ATP-binding protein [Streptomyces sp. NPDC002082]|uniref:ATP-binding protein n=1 Tax=Streptomyces sp. NPDC002082 TaxID=3154772 RepID=UPI00333384EF